MARIEIKIWLGETKNINVLKKLKESIIENGHVCIPNAYGSGLLMISNDGLVYIDIDTDYCGDSVCTHLYITLLGADEKLPYLVMDIMDIIVSAGFKPELNSISFE